MATQLERFRDTVAHRRPDGFLAYANFTDDLKNRLIDRCGTDDLVGHFDMFDPAMAAVKRVKPFEPDFTRYYTEDEVVEGSNFDRFGVLHQPGSCYHFTHKVSPLRHARSLDDIEAFPIENVAETHTDEGMKEAVDAAHAEGRAAICWVGHMYENAWQIRDYEEFLVDLMTQPEWADSILERICLNNIFKVEAAARAGCDGIFTGDDVANQNALMFPPDIWREHIKSRWARVYAAARAIKPDIEIKYHSDGNIAEIVPELIEIGVTILNPVQPECVDVNGLKERFGDKLVFDGTVGTQSTMPWGDPDEVRRVVKERLDVVGRDGAIIVSPTHVLEPEVPIENIEAMFEAVREYGGAS